MKKTRKTNNKAMTVGIALAAVAITGVAFSTWIIVNDQSSTVTGNITLNVADVEDQSIIIRNAKVDDGAISFDCKKDDSTGPIQYSQGSGDTGEDLNFSMSFDIENAWDGSAFESYYGGFQLTWTITDTSSAFSTAISSGYIVAPWASESELTFGKPTNLTEDTNTVKVQSFTATHTAGSDNDVHVAISAEFAWGTYFGTSNPGDYAGSDASTISSYLSGLNSLKSLDSVTIAFTVAPVRA